MDTIFDRLLRVNSIIELLIRTLLYACSMDPYIYYPKVTFLIVIVPIFSADSQTPRLRR